MIKVYSTKEVSLKTGLSDRSVRRRIYSGDSFGPTVLIANGKKVTYGITEDGLNNWLAKNVDGRMSDKMS